MNVSDAGPPLNKILSNTPVSDDIIRELLAKSARALRGNAQPWQIQVINGGRMQDFMSYRPTSPAKTPAYDIYPKDLPLLSRQPFKVGEDMYGPLESLATTKPRDLHIWREILSFFAPPRVFLLDR